MNQVDMTEDVRLDVPASYKYLNVVSACLGAVLEQTDGIESPEILTHNVELAVHETCTNIVQHAYAGRGGRIELNIRLLEEPRRVIVEVHDTGEAFDLSTVAEPDLNSPQLNGYGLFLIRQLLDEVTYVPQDGNNHWRLVKNLEDIQSC
jgi:serine/threonine-protein kinase RsbW